jgi:hypothetical protein
VKEVPKEELLGNIDDISDDDDDDDNKESADGGGDRPDLVRVLFASIPGEIKNDVFFVVTHS